MSYLFESDEHEALREQARRFASRAIASHAHEWEEAGEFPRALYAKCAEAGILLPVETLTLAKKSLTDSQDADGGWAYYEKGSVASYGAMSAGGVASLAIYDHLLKQEPKKDPAVRAGITWLGDFFATQ